MKLHPVDVLITIVLVILLAGTAILLCWNPQP